MATARAPGGTLNPMALGAVAVALTKIIYTVASGTVVHRY